MITVNMVRDEIEVTTRDGIKFTIRDLGEYVTIRGGPFVNDDKLQYDVIKVRDKVPDFKNFKVLCIK